MGAGGKLVYADDAIELQKANVEEPEIPSPEELLGLDKDKDLGRRSGSDSDSDSDEDPAARMEAFQAREQAHADMQAQATARAEELAAATLEATKRAYARYKPNLRTAARKATRTPMPAFIGQADTRAYGLLRFDSAQDLRDLRT